MSFDMQDAETVSALFSIGKLSSRKSLSTEAEKIDVFRVPYSFEVGSPACATTCVLLNIAGAMRVMSQYVAKEEGDCLTKPMEKFNSLRLVVT